MKLLIVGASGLVGRGFYDFMVRNSSCETIGTYYSHSFEKGVYLDITRKPEISKVLDQYQPDVVVWLAGLKDVAACEKDHQLSRKINEKPIMDFLDVTTNHSAATKLVYISSDYVFDGQKGAYTTSDPCCPDTVYGKSKLLVEECLKRAGSKYVLLRLAAVMSAYGGFLGWLLGKLRSDGNIRLYSNTIFSPTPSLSASKAIAHVIEHSMWNKTLHFAGEPVSRYEFGRRVACLLGVSPERIVPELADTVHSTFHKDLSLVTSPKLSDLVPDESDLLIELGWR